MKYDHVLLDADNTLLDFDAAQEGAFKDLLACFGAEYSDQAYAHYSEINHGYWRRLEQGTITKDLLQTERFEVFFSTLGIKVNGNEANAFYQKALSKQAKLIPNAIKVCCELSKRACLSIVTNGVGSTAYSRIGLSGLKEYMSHIIVSEVIGCAKPDAAFFKAVFDIIGCSSTDKIIIVGDSLSSDIQGGINAGIETCWFNPKGVKSHVLKPDYVISDLRQLLDIID